MTTTVADTREPGARRLVGVLGLAVVGFAVQQTAIIPAIADVQRSLHASPEWAAWLVTVYLTVATVATLAMGRLGDLHGRRRMLLLGLTVFAVASVGAALAPNIAVLIVFRALQGVGGAVYPLTLAIARDRVPDGRTTAAIGALTAAFGAGTAIGFVGGGLLGEYVTWRLIFGLGAVLVGAGALLVHRVVPETGERAGGGFDMAGTVVLGVAAVGMLTALTLVVPQGWASPATIGLFVLAAAALLCWVLVERRVADPLVDLHVLGERPVLIANLGTIGLGWALFGSFLLIPQFARTPAAHGFGLGLAGTGVGLVLLPIAVGQMIGAPAAGVAVRRLPPRLVYAAGLLALAVASAVLCVTRGDVLLLAGADLLLGVGAGTALQAASVAATEGVAADVAAVSASLNSTIRRLAGGVGGQVATILLASLALAPLHPRFTAYVVAYAVAATLCLLGAVTVAVAPRG